MSVSPTFMELRALAALEVELDHLVAEKVAEARLVSGMSWDQVAAAMGLSRPAAWRRWKDVVDDPRPTRPKRRDAGQLLLTAEAAPSVAELTSLLRQRLLDRQDSHPWSGAARVALDRLGLQYETRQLSAREIQYQVRGTRFMISCVEPSTSGAGGVTVTFIPNPERKPEGDNKPRSAHVTSDGLLPVSGEALVQSVLELIGEELEAK